VACLSHHTSPMHAEDGAILQWLGVKKAAWLACSVIRDASASDNLGKVKNGEVERFPILSFFHFIMDFVQCMEVLLLEWKFSVWMAAGPDVSCVSL